MALDLKILLVFGCKKSEDGKGIIRKSRLTIAKCDVIQKNFGRAIRDNKDNPEAMSKSAWAILKHYSSTPAETNHEDCPEKKKIGVVFSEISVPVE